MNLKRITTETSKRLVYNSFERAVIITFARK